MGNRMVCGRVGQSIKRIELREKRIKMGLCAICGDEKEQENKLNCDKCLLKARASYKKHKKND